MEVSTLAPSQLELHCGTSESVKIFTVYHVARNCQGIKLQISNCLYTYIEFIIVRESIELRYTLWKMSQ